MLICIIINSLLKIINLLWLYKTYNVIKQVKDVWKNTIFADNIRLVLTMINYGLWKNKNLFQITSSKLKDKSNKLKILIDLCKLKKNRWLTI